jgi:hypothetical protein
VFPYAPDFPIGAISISFILAVGTHIFPEIYFYFGDNGDKFATGIKDAGGKLPPIATTLAAICHRCHRQ